ncbi:protein tramtrack, beta isoform-like [Pollicipes pollicipes]|uniref:protein tramtrack, beta isoform-like n=1 Tax=Pollicipes pollicipes TaxID=41117 RepID=UPI001884F4E4|nr:protein tramtrack, beta isoform-like [Pollicipes pollicipes]
MDATTPVQHFSLRWNNFQSTITSALAGLRDTQAFVDVTLWTDGQQIKAHRNVLSACSPVLLELLKDNPCAHPIIILRDVTPADLTAIVTYMYQGEVNVAPESLRTFLHTAQLLKVKGLADTGIQQEADACVYDSPVSAGSESPRPVSPPKRRRPLPPEPAPAPPLPPPPHVLTAAPGIDPASSMHSPVRRSRWCESCAKMIVRDFARHKREVHGEAKPLPCDLCGSVFKYKRSLQVHVKRKHDISWDNYRQVVDGPPPPPAEPTNSSSRLCSCSRTCRGLKLHISNGFGRRRRCPAH